MNEQLLSCPICETTVTDAYWVSDEHRKSVDCPLCGRYRITGMLNENLWDRRQQGTLDTDAALLTRLSAAIRHLAIPPLIDMENWREIAKAAPRFSMDTKQRRLLEQIARWAPIGHSVGVDDFYFRVLEAEIVANDSEEVQLLLSHLMQRRLLKGEWMSNGVLGSAMITVEGWSLLEPTSGVPGRCFVAMWFDKSMDAVYDQGIAAAVRECGLDPRRVDKIDFEEKICDRIVAEIRAAEVVIADFTGFRSGVFYEAGFAQALGKLVILTCRDDQLAELAKHFDTRQFPHLPWADSSDLRVKLTDRLRALRSVPRPVSA